MGRPKGSKNKPKDEDGETLLIGPEFYHRHRGPFYFNVTRQEKVTKNNPTGLASYYLQTRMDGTEVQEEAEALLTDPRDTIISVSVWSDPEQQHVITFRRKAA